MTEIEQTNEQSAVDVIKSTCWEPGCFYRDLLIQFLACSATVYFSYQITMMNIDADNQRYREEARNNEAALASTTLAREKEIWSQDKKAKEAALLSALCAVNANEKIIEVNLKQINLDNKLLNEGGRVLTPLYHLDDRIFENLLKIPISQLGTTSTSTLSITHFVDQDSFVINELIDKRNAIDNISIAIYPNPTVIRKYNESVSKSLEIMPAKFRDIRKGLVEMSPENFQHDYNKVCVNISFPSIEVNPLREASIFNAQAADRFVP